MSMMGPFFTRMGALSRYLVLFEPPSAARYTLASFGVV
jgi:hypothetical protein